MMHTCGYRSQKDPVWLSRTRALAPFVLHVLVRRIPECPVQMLTDPCLVDIIKAQASNQDPVQPLFGTSSQDKGTYAN
jgi:hypothetical protein